MATQLRIARLDGSGLNPLAENREQLFRNHDALTRVVRRHLPPVTAALFATPRAAAEGATVEWYSELSGQPTPLTALPAAAQQEIRQLLANRLASVNKLADELPRLDPDAAHLADDLRRALSYPGDDYVYAVGGQPVIAFWGHENPTRPASHPAVGAAGPGAARAAAAVPGAATAAAGATPRRGMNRWLFGIPLVLLLIGAFFWWRWSEQEALRSELMAQLDAMQGDCAALLTLTGRLGQVDPDGTRYPELRSRLDAELDTCQLAEQFEQQFAAARGDCIQLGLLSEALEDHDTSKAPLSELRASVDAELATCGLVAQFEQDLAAAIGDCRKLAALDQDTGNYDPQSARFQIARNQLNAELERCQLAAQFEQQLAAAAGDCPQLAVLDESLSGYDTRSAPLNGVRERVDTALARCQLEANFEQQLAAAGDDCERLAALDQALSGHDTSSGPLKAVREQLDAKLNTCRMVAEFDQALQAALGDCKRLAELGQTTKVSNTDDQRLRTLRNRLDTALEQCRVVDNFEQQMAAAGTDCRQLKQLDQALAGQDGSGERLRTIRNRLDTELARCAKPKPADPPKVAAKPKPADPPKPKPADPPKESKPEKPSKPPKKAEKPKSTDPLKLCPGERPKELAPDLIVVFDASGSMEKQIAGNSSIERQLLRQFGPLGNILEGVIGSMDPNLPRRIDAAKKATRQIVSDLPQDVDVGLVLVEDCPRARQVGFFSPAQRGQLLRGIDSITPIGGTPLASGIMEAARMVDGVNAPGVLVVVSDGRESCNANPCAVARNLSRSKPKLIINVVDIMGTGAGTCVARATNGRVFTATNAQQFSAMMREATQVVRGPKGCK